MGKSEVYSWRLSPELKTDLEEAARAEQRSLAQLLEEIAEEWLTRFRDRGEDDRERQERIRQAAMKSVGAIHGDDPRRAENARSEIRARLARRHAR
jgi:predicted DNA-binding protein